MSAPATVKTWQKTKLQNLLRHKSGGYYARLFLNGKEVWKSLKTKTFSIAETRLATAQSDNRQRRGVAVSASSAKMTFGEAGELHLKQVDERPDLKRRSKAYWRELYTALLKSWPELADLQIRQMTKTACREWAAKYSKKASATRYNNTIALVGHVIALAMEGGVVFTNVAECMERKTVKSKHLELPTLEQFSAFIQEMNRPKGRYSKPSAEFAQGLAFTGCRVSEARRIAWRDLEFTKGEIVVKGDPEEGTKNGEIRRIPMIPSARALFEKMRAERADEPLTASVFQVSRCQESMDSAAEKVGITRMTHHDLRHFFATICIESGVDIPTVSRWLGHKDGGALAMKVYGHLRREHSISQALKVTFVPIAA